MSLMTQQTIMPMREVLRLNYMTTPPTCHDKQLVKVDD